MTRILGILLFIAILIGSFTAINKYLFSKIENYEATSVYNELFNGKNKADIIVLGTSHGVHAFGYEIKNIKDKYVVKNFSYSASSPEYHYKWYVNYFKKYYAKKPILVIYCADWLIFDGEVLSKKIEHDAYCLPATVFYKQLLTNPNAFNDMVVNRYPIIKINKENMSHLQMFYRFMLPIDSKNTVVAKPVSDLLDISLQTKLTYGKVDDYQVYYFNLLLKELKNDNIAVLLVQPPEYLPGEYSVNFSANNKLIDYFASLHGIRFLNYNNEYKSSINFNKENFYDWGHMVKAGREVFLDKFYADLNNIIDDIIK